MCIESYECIVVVVIVVIVVIVVVDIIDKRSEYLYYSSRNNNTVTANADVGHTVCYQPSPFCSRLDDHVDHVTRRVPSPIFATNVSSRVNVSPRVKSVVRHRLSTGFSYRLVHLQRRSPRVAIFIVICSEWQFLSDEGF
jgi:hypothetical protein